MALPSQKYKQNYGAFRIQNLSEGKKEQTKGTEQFIYSSTCKNSKINRLVIRRICFCPDKFWAKACKI